jgi:hypothetical protein
LAEIFTHTKQIMNKILKLPILILFLLGFSEVSFAQSIQIIPMGGYQFPAGVDVSYNDGVSGFRPARLRIKGNGNYGIGLHVTLPFQEITISAAFSNMESEMTIQPAGQPTEKLFDASQEYWMFGILRQIDMDQLQPYGGILLGWTTIRPQDTDYRNGSEFSVGLEGGVKYFFNDVIGIMAHARLLLPVQWFGAGFSIGTGGAGAGLNIGSTIIQGDIGGGLVIAFNR